MYTRFQNLRPVHNHPAALLKLKEGDPVGWWESMKDKKVLKNMTSVVHSNKLLAMLHIIVQCTEIGDKVLVFANSLPTLDYVEDVLELEDWARYAPSLKISFPEKKKLGGWKSGQDFLR